MIDSRPALFAWLGLCAFAITGMLIWEFAIKPWRDAEAAYASVKLEQEHQQAEDAFKREQTANTLALLREQAAHAAFMRSCVPTTSEARCNELWRWTAPANREQP